jgi:hypothetical protein
MLYQDSNASAVLRFMLPALCRCPAACLIGA